jgi:2-oxoglutarate ferredoxin oxidoreductase subunit gamma
MKTTILIAGEGGQGIQTIAKIISDAAAQTKNHVSYIPSFGVEQRGTPSMAFIIISSQNILYPKFEKADYVVVLQRRAVDHVLPYVSNTTKVIFDSSTVPSDGFRSKEHLFGIPATQIAIEERYPRSFNVVVAGKISQILYFNEEIVWSTIEKVLGKKFKTPEIKELNHKAFLAGRSFTFEVQNFSKPVYQPSTNKIMVKGHGKTCQLSPEYCKGCGICITKCPVGALRFSDTLGVFATPVPEIDLEKCIACGNCLRFCPDGAIGVQKDAPTK